jgi:GAF domain-containing protein
MTAGTSDHIATCLALTKAIGKSLTVDEIYEAGLDALRSGLGVDRASILLSDPDAVMRVKACRGLSDAYRRAVEGHTPWRTDSPDLQPIWVEDVTADPSLASYLPALAAENIAAMAFIPLISLERLIGEFILCYAAPTPASVEVLQLASVIAAQVAFAIERTLTEHHARWNEERLRFALDAASVGTWDWDLQTNAVRWSDNVARLHGLPDGSFDGTFAG